MRKFIFFLVPIFLLLAIGCEKNPDNTNGSLDLNFKATYEGQPLVMFSEAYEYPGDHEIKFQLFQYFLSDITLLRNVNDVEGTLLSEVELIEYKDQITLEASEQGVSFSFNDLPGGQYEAIRFGLGVAPDLNATDPGDYSPNAPLSDHYWSAARGYVFAKIEGRADRTGDGEFDTGLTYHVGADELYQTLTFPIDLNVNEMSAAQANFSVDLKEVMHSENGNIDIHLTRNTIDHTNNPQTYNTLWNNLSDALEMRN